VDTLDSMQLALSHAVEVAPLIKRLPTDEALRKLAAVKEEMELAHEGVTVESIRACLVTRDLELADSIDDKDRSNLMAAAIDVENTHQACMQKLAQLLDFLLDAKLQKKQDSNG